MGQWPDWNKLISGVITVAVGAAAVAAVVATGGAATPVVAVALTAVGTAGTVTAVTGAADVVESFTDQNAIKDFYGEETYDSIQLTSMWISSAGTVWAAESIPSISVGTGNGKKVEQSPGWNVGDPVSNKTKAGNTPSWSTVRSRFWKNEASDNSSRYTSTNLTRMKKGLAPIGADSFSMELHHPFGRAGENIFIFKKLTRMEHRMEHYGHF